MRLLASEVHKTHNMSHLGVSTRFPQRALALLVTSTGRTSSRLAGHVKALIAAALITLLYDNQLLKTSAVFSSVVA
jgi:hypothetical protein